MHAPLPLYVTNTLGKKLEEFKPVDSPRVRLYSCGPTVYSYAHIGNFRAFIFADTLRRTLEYNGYDVTHVRNITDVGHLTNDTLSTGADRVEAMAAKQNVTPWDIAEHYAAVFLRDAAMLNLKEPHHQPRATEYVPAMIELTQDLVNKGFAYEAAGNIYYKVDKFPRYGALSGNTVSDLVAGARVEVGSKKQADADFALWRAAGPDRIMRWDSPWGEGVPGWHVECSAMSMNLLGEQIDIHTGAVDNIFPHHEDEIAQSEGATGKQFVRYWMHNEWLQTMDEEKMSKSVGNIYTVSDLLARGVHPYAYRYFTFQAHYRRPLNFSWDALGAAQTALVRLWETTAGLLQSAEPAPATDAGEAFRLRFQERINHDLDLPGALAVVHDLSASRLPPGEKLSLLDDFDLVLGLDLLETGRKLIVVSDAEAELLSRRAEARLSKDWALSDSSRDTLMEGGLEIKDTAGGQQWVRRDFLVKTVDQLKNRAEKQPEGKAN